MTRYVDPFNTPKVQHFFAVKDIVWNGNENVVKSKCGKVTLALSVLAFKEMKKYSQNPDNACSDCFPLEKSQNVQNLPNESKIPQNQMEIENRDIENCKVAAWTSKPLLSIPAYNAVCDILNGVYKGYIEVRDTNYLQKILHRPINSMETLQARRKMNNRAFMVAHNWLPGPYTSEVLHTLDTEFDALRFISDFFKNLDSSKVQ